MKNTMRINENVTVGPQPSAAELQELRQQGFRSIVNFRTDDEDDQEVTPQAEAQAVKGLGMEYLHLPVSTSSMEPELVDKFRRQFADLPKPVFAHCKSGKRSGAMVMMNTAVQQGMTGEQTIEKAHEMGFECDKPELVDFVKNYVDTHSNSS